MARVERRELAGHCCRSNRRFALALEGKKNYERLYVDVEGMYVVSFSIARSCEALNACTSVLD